MVATTAVPSATLRTRLLPSSTTYSVPRDTATSTGACRAAAVPVPSVEAATPLPHSVVTAPEARSITRILWLPRSATKAAAESPATSMPMGWLKAAALPTPSAHAAAALPASARTRPSTAARRTRFPARSVTRKCVALSTAMPWGALKVAAEPAPLAAPAELLPARVETSAPMVDTRRSLLPAASATTSEPVPGRCARPAGLLKEATVPRPSAQDALPEPARVEAAPPSVTRRMRFPSSATYSAPSRPSAMPVGS